LEDLFSMAYISEEQVIQTLSAEDVRAAAQAFFQALHLGLRVDQGQRI
jgi:hypothetical protein